jgi:hypothetical protein
MLEKGGLNHFSSSSIHVFADDEGSKPKLELLQFVLTKTGRSSEQNLERNLF